MTKSNIKGIRENSGDEEIDEVKKAEKLLMEKSQKELKACADEIQAVLTVHGYALDVQKPQIALIKVQKQ